MVAKTVRLFFTRLRRTSVKCTMYGWNLRGYAGVRMDGKGSDVRIVRHTSHKNHGRGNNNANL